jgi:uncharacterized protein YecE (DUF72 family)
MTTRYHIAAKELRGQASAYGKRFDFLEVKVTPAAGSTVDAPKLTPTLATLRKWRKEVPPAFDFCVVASPAVARLKPGPELDHELAVTKAAIDALRARCVLLKTPPDVTPSGLHRERMAKLLEQFPQDATYVVWEPAGVWELGDAAYAAKKWGITLAVDAARDPVPPGPVAYARLRALGETRSFGTAALERVADAIGDRRDAFVVIETEQALAECKKLRQVAQDRKRGAEGGYGRLIRPRGTFVVGDDEQE